MLLMPLVLSAFESFPEYMGAEKHDVTKFDSLQEIDSEYQSDYNSFLLPFGWQATWLSSKNIFDATTGSLSSKRFMQRYRFKLSQELSSSLDVKIKYFDESDFERQDKHLIFEFVKWLPNKKFAIALEGETSTYKAEDDIGFALMHKFSDDSLLRLFHRRIDFSNNKRSVNDEIYIKKPSASGIVYRKVKNSNEYLEAFLSYEPELELHKTTQNEFYKYKRNVLGMDMRKEARDLGYWGLRLHLETKSKEQGHNGTKQEVYRNLINIEREWEKSILGYHHAHRKYRAAENSDELNHHIPYFYYKLSTKENHWRLGLDGTAFTSNQEEKYEYRLNAIYRYKFNDRAETNILLSFDLDRPKSQLWEGGNMQFRANF